VLAWVRTQGIDGARGNRWSISWLIWRIAYGYMGVSCGDAFFDSDIGG